MKKIFLFIVVLALNSCKEKQTFSKIYRTYEIIKSDSTFHITGTFTSYDTSTFVKACGIVRITDKMLFGYNDSLIQLSNEKIIPKGVGVTNMKIRYSDGEVDSIKLDIRKSKGKFIISFPTSSLGTQR